MPLHHHAISFTEEKCKCGNITWYPEEHQKAGSNNESCSGRSPTAWVRIPCGLILDLRVGYLRWGLWSLLDFTLFDRHLPELLLSFLSWFPQPLRPGPAPQAIPMSLAFVTSVLTLTMHTCIWTCESRSPARSAHMNKNSQLTLIG